jgi:DHA2 family multidrug resistance protein-like MFS transporter
LIGAGLVIAAVGLAVLTLLDTAPPLAVIVTGSVIYSLGFTPVVILATDIIVGSVPVERAGSASAISETGSELGGALGVAILGSIGMAVYRARMATGVPTGVPSDASEIARGTLGGASAVADRLGFPLGTDLLSAARDAFTQAFVVTAAVNALLVVVTAIAAMLTFRHIRNVTNAGE